MQYEKLQRSLRKYRRDNPMSLQKLAYEIGIDFKTLVTFLCSEDDNYSPYEITILRIQNYLKHANYIKDDDLL
jgi:hypothetical protein